LKKEQKNRPQEEKERLGLTFDHDGEFYMALEDFVQNFDSVDICHLTSGAIDDDGDGDDSLSWHETAVKGEWVEGCWLF
jgi:calpain